MKLVYKIILNLMDLLSHARVARPAEIDARVVRRQHWQRDRRTEYGVTRFGTGHADHVEALHERFLDDNRNRMEGRVRKPKASQKAMARSNNPPRSRHRTLPHMSQTTSSFSTYSCNSDCWSARRAHFNMA